ncbi:conserved hypothetical protein [Planktothrix sp. PCC 11201]|uniref:hypothetical protein n=1 Tax=Planktothrix sp. PCC 11201 TaxID=1729650 RepID=UPI000912ECE1|nr:hypothetical protein [Planktothrix sp. PCC 11201]SKB15166.1 conserved hypothetical protein [Planktothrix sp. PCC 11201]
MNISDLNYLEVVSETVAVQGGLKNTISFSTKNSFTLNINVPSLSPGNYASAGAKAVTDPGIYDGTLNSFTMANTLAVATYGTSSLSSSNSVAAIAL